MGAESKVKAKEAKDQANGSYSSQYREILPMIFNQKTEISKISECGKNGDMSFAIDCKSLGVPYSEFEKCLGEIFTPFVADFWGELLVRENLDSFLPHLTSFDAEEFSDAVSGGEDHTQHKRFGMKIVRGAIVFKFQISLLNDILIEHFNHQFIA